MAVGRGSAVGVAFGFGRRGFGGDALAAGLGEALSGIAFVTRGDSSGWMVSLITSTGGLAHVTGMLRCTIRLTVAISR